MNTCDKCTHYTPDSDKYGINKLHAIPVNNDGSCSLMGDINQRSNPVDSCSGWDTESYGAGVYVGPKFGCIHWIKKEQAEDTDTPLTNLIAEAVEFYWGERCPEHEDGCPVCEGWRQYDNLTGERK